MTETRSFRAAIVGDIHFRGSNELTVQKTFVKMAENADVLFLAGDLIDDGRANNAAIVGRLVQNTGVPAYGVLGNHEHRGETEAVAATYTTAGIRLLRTERDTISHNGVELDVIGLKGGYDGTLAPLPNPDRSHFIGKGLEGLRPQLEEYQALIDSIDDRNTVILTHYATTYETVLGEDSERFDLHGSLALGQIADSRSDRVKAIFHGHTHRGGYTGKTAGDIPVYNVSFPVLAREAGLTRESAQDDPPICIATFDQSGMIDIFVSS